jgi:hypothetical protein
LRVRVVGLHDKAPSDQIENHQRHLDDLHDITDKIGYLFRIIRHPHGGDPVRTRRVT